MVTKHIIHLRILVSQYQAKTYQNVASTEGWIKSDIKYQDENQIKIIQLLLGGNYQQSINDRLDEIRHRIVTKNIKP